jgi:RNA 3'-terminal phosphate cyclase-like protein
MIEASRSVLNRYIPDIYLHSDVYKGEESGKSPGYALSLLAETTEGTLFCAEAVSTPRADPHQAKEGKTKRDKIFGEEPDDVPLPTTPEEVALTASRSLLLEIQKGGCVDRKHQWFVLLYMVLGSEDVGRVKMGPLSPRRYVETMQSLLMNSLRHLIVSNS